MNEYIQEAENQIDKIEESEAKAALKKLMYYCVNRENKYMKNYFCSFQLP